MNIKRRGAVRLNKVEPTHRKWTTTDTFKDFWMMNKPLIGLLIVIICISILLFMMGYAAATGHLHFLSTEANNYEHLNQIVCKIRGPKLW